MKRPPPKPPEVEGQPQPAVRRAQAAWAGPAQAGTPIQLGQLSQGDPGTCGIVTDVVQAAVAGPPSYTVPSDGVITSWSHRGNDIAPGTGRLQLWRSIRGVSSPANHSLSQMNSAY